MSDITYEEFTRAVTADGYPQPSHSQYEYFIKGVRRLGMSRTEAAMFLAQVIHESGGLQHTEEQCCTGGCRRAQEYCPYHGRGYIQLTWDYNYRDASNGLGLGNRLVDNPDLVKQEKYAWDTSFWFWDARVRPKLGGGRSFGASTAAINGGLEPAGSAGAQRRFELYQKVFRALNCPGSPQP